MSPSVRIALALLLLAAGFLLLAPMLTYPFGSDHGSFAAVADVIARGGVPYRDVWEIKPPGIYYLFWAVFAAFGRSIFALRLADLLWTLPAALAILLLLIGESRRSNVTAALSGLAIGLASLLKFTLGGLLLIPFVASFLSRNEPARSRLARAASCLAGCLLALAAVGLLLAKAGALREMVEIVFSWNSQYGKVQPSAPKPLLIAYQLASFHFRGQYLILSSPACSPSSASPT